MGLVILRSYLPECLSTRFNCLLESMLQGTTFSHGLPGSAAALGHPSGASCAPPPPWGTARQFGPCSRTWGAWVQQAERTQGAMTQHLNEWRDRVAPEQMNSFQVHARPSSALTRPTTIAPTTAEACLARIALHQVHQRHSCIEFSALPKGIPRTASSTESSTAPSTAEAKVFVPLQKVLAGLGEALSVLAHKRGEVAAAGGVAGAVGGGSSGMRRPAWLLAAVIQA
eukprot:990419-Pelagomonas_calceolata.AAC.6